MTGDLAAFAITAALDVAIGAVAGGAAAMILGRCLQRQLSDAIADALQWREEALRAQLRRDLSRRSEGGRGALGGAGLELERLKRANDAAKRHVAEAAAWIQSAEAGDVERLQRANEASLSGRLDGELTQLRSDPATATGFRRVHGRDPRPGEI